MKNNIIVAFLLVLFFTSCKEPTTIDHQLIIFDSSAKTFEREIPLSSNGRPDIFYTSTKANQLQLELDSLENGFDGLQIRIWYDVAYINKQKVVIISYSKAHWTASVYKMVPIWETKDRYHFSKKPNNVTPKSGWTNFSNELLNLQILTLPNGNDDQNCGAGGGDGSTYNVEIATKKHYRYYGYWEPEEYRDKCQQAKNMSDILRLLKKELGIE